MQALKDFDVYEEIGVNRVPPHLAKQAIDTRFVTSWKGGECKARLVVKDYWREVKDHDDLYASTPLLTTIKVLLLIALQLGWRIILGDVSTAFLHAKLEKEFYVWPPKEY